MTDFVVRCPNCTQGSRVPFEARGLTVECPRCSLHFTALPEPTAKPPRNPSAPVPTVAPSIPPDEPHPDHEHHTFTPHGLLIAVALLPLGVPLLWLTASLITGKQPVFSFVAPVAMALGAGGLCAGIASVHIWSFASRIRAMLAVVVLGYAIAGVLYFTKPSWIEVTRKLFQGFAAFPGNTEYRPKDRSYSVRFPGNPTPDGAVPFQGGWRLNEVVTFSDPRRTGEEVFTAAHGLAPIDFPLTPSDEKLFGSVKEELLKVSGAKLLNEIAVASADATIREYELQMPDGVNKRHVRIARAGTRVYYLAVEGPFLAADVLEVRDFFRSFRLLKK
jgi:hypothetical protein